MLKNIYRKITKVLFEEETTNYYDEEIIEEISAITDIQNSLILEW